MVPTLASTQNFRIRSCDIARDMTTATSQYLKLRIIKIAEAINKMEDISHKKPYLRGTSEEN